MTESPQQKPEPRITYMMGTGFGNLPLKTNVWDEAIARIHKVYDFDLPVVVSISGGKDSTTVMQLTLLVARERKRLPLTVLMMDEEINDPDTYDYLYRIQQTPDIEMAWVCLPVRHSLRSQLRTHWYPWNPKHKDVWAREKPSFAITELPGIIDHNNSYASLTKAYGDYRGWDDMVAMVGVRTQESFNRARAILLTGDWITGPGGYRYAKPIFDWGWKDVWRAIQENEWDYSRFYPKAFAKGVGFHHQRISVWGNVAQSNHLHILQELYPDFWKKAIIRLPELITFARHGKNSLYRGHLPHGLTWQEFTYVVLNSIEDEADRNRWRKQIEGTILRWNRLSSVPFPDRPTVTDDRPMARSWQQIAIAVLKNDNMGGGTRDPI